MSLASSSENVLVAPAVPEFTFQDLNLSAPLLAALNELNYVTPTPIQAGTIPLLLEGRDVVGQAQTGTGKTAAFAIPMLERIDLNNNTTQVLVLAPTRELALQVAEAFERYSSKMRGLRVTSIYGGQDYTAQFRALDRGAHVVVGTPGRVLDHIRRGTLKVAGLRGLVLDEADEMLRMGFADDVEFVLTQVPAERQIALFSATMPDRIRKIAQQHLRNPVEITIKQKSATADTIQQRFLVVAPHQKQFALARLLETETIDGVLVFVKTKSSTEPLADYLATQGYRTGALSSDVSQKQRERIVDNLKAGKIDVIIATDVAARGLDVPRISHVINYDLPFDSESYVHRIGRTGRAGRTGQAILFVHPRDRNQLRKIEQGTRQRIEPMTMPTADLVNRRREAKFHEKITTALAHPNLNSLASLIERYRSEHDIPIEKIAAALATLAVGDSQLFVTEELRAPDFADARDSRNNVRDPMRTPMRRDGRFERDSRPVRGDVRPSFDARPTADARPGVDPRFAARAERPPVGDRPAKRRFSEPMETFRIEVGRAHRVKPGNIVGAIAGETGLESDFIGRIEIFEEFSTVDMVVGMPDEMFNALKKVWVSGRRLNITRSGETPEASEAGAVEGPREDRPAKSFKPRRAPLKS